MSKIKSVNYAKWESIDNNIKMYHKETWEKHVEKPLW